MNFDPPEICHKELAQRRARLPSLGEHRKPTDDEQIVFWCMVEKDVNL